MERARQAERSRQGAGGAPGGAAKRTARGWPPVVGVEQSSTRKSRGPPVRAGGPFSPASGTDGATGRAARRVAEGVACPRRGSPASLGGRSPGRHPPPLSRQNEEDERRRSPRAGAGTAADRPSRAARWGWGRGRAGRRPREHDWDRTRVCVASSPPVAADQPRVNHLPARRRVLSAGPNKRHRHVADEVCARGSPAAVRPLLCGSQRLDPLFPFHRHEPPFEPMRPRSRRQPVRPQRGGGPSRKRNGTRPSPPTRRRCVAATSAGRRGRDGGCLRAVGGGGGYVMR